MELTMEFYKEKRISVFFILINLLFLTKGLIPSFKMAYVGMLYLILAISFFYFYKVNANYSKSGFIIALNIFVLLITIYGVIALLQPVNPQILSILPDYRPHTYLTNAYIPLLQIYPLYFFSRKGYINEHVIRNWVIPSVIVAVLAFYVSQLKITGDINAGTVEGTSNVGYLVVSIIPTLYFLKNIIVKYSMLIFVIVFVFLCAKRGAILIAGISLLWILYHDMKKSSETKKFLILILVAVASLFIYQYVQRIFEESYYMNYLLEKTMEGNSSGRDVLYLKAWENFLNADFFIFLFGNGADSTYVILGNRAHSDWLELLTNQGLIGFIIYVTLWIQIFLNWTKIKTNRSVFVILGSIVIIFFMKSFFSMWYNSISPIACIPFAWCMAKIDEYRKQQLYLYNKPIGLKYDK